MLMHMMFLLMPMCMSVREFLLALVPLRRRVGGGVVVVETGERHERGARRRARGQVGAAGHSPARDAGGELFGAREAVVGGGGEGDLFGFGDRYHCWGLLAVACSLWKWKKAGGVGLLGWIADFACYFTDLDRTF